MNERDRPLQTRLIRGVIMLGFVAPSLLLLATPLITLGLAASSVTWLVESGARSARVALALSAQTSAISLGLMALFGTPCAWWLAHQRGLLRRVLSLVIMVPLLLPPSIVGLTLLEATRAGGWVSQCLDWCARGCVYWNSGLHTQETLSAQLPFSYSAVILAQLVVSAPLYVMGAVATFERRSFELVEVARGLGASPLEIWRRVTLPSVAPGLMIALSLAGARALGEFGATLLFAGNLSGYTQTAPLAIYLELEQGTRGALAISIALLGYALPLLLGVAVLGRRLSKDTH